MPENKTTGRKSIRYSFKYTNTTKRINKMKNNLKKSLVSLISAMGICVTAAAGFGSAACAKQATEAVNTAIVRGGTAVCTVLAVNQDDLDDQVHLEMMRALVNLNQRDKAMLEPGFICEQLGIQGRADLITTDMQLLVEQSSRAPRAGKIQQRDEGTWMPGDRCLRGRG